ncbi:MAG: hypothetical protein ACYC9O_09910 [Candidatus Latescibacterota bacterium]
MEKEKAVSEDTTRREVLKKTGKTVAFAMPVIMSFKVNELKAKASGSVGGLPEPPEHP